MKYHEPVLLREVEELLQPSEGKVFIDCTLGDGGHTLSFLSHKCKVLAMDINKSSIDRAFGRVKEKYPEADLTCVLGNFKNVTVCARENGINQVNGIIFDLGYSSFQLEEGDLGLSFLKNDILDMRLDSSLSVTAADLVNKLPEMQIKDILRMYGGEKMAGKFAHRIVEYRKLKNFRFTKDLAELLKNAVSSGYERGRIHPATRTFQALRIAVNDELENLKVALPQAARLLLPGGRMAIISFHSLEDEIAKNFGSGVQPKIRKINKKPIVPSKEEVDSNSRCRSAKMRVYERI